MWQDMKGAASFEILAKQGKLSEKLSGKVLLHDVGLRHFDHTDRLLPKIA